MNLDEKSDKVVSLDSIYSLFYLSGAENSPNTKISCMSTIRLQVNSNDMMIS
ncbi:hypothetical protein KIN20_000759 [Parelaphostrongylus tenuis]|uniref:Uncharacterized protein n=1 Tax=Parelaphostrongylus tenuis TaxID=148309 RepID=A0AAD5MBU1_PARTN|nr:hypothetical protein KIN20_000759 [Parelaphostrongylus tenuis]